MHKESSSAPWYLDIFVSGLQQSAFLMPLMRCINWLKCFNLSLYGFVFLWHTDLTPVIFSLDPRWVMSPKDILHPLIWIFLQVPVLIFFLTCSCFCSVGLAYCSTCSCCCHCITRAYSFTHTHTHTHVPCHILEHRLLTPMCPASSTPWPRPPSTIHLWGTKQLYLCWLWHKLNMQLSGCSVAVACPRIKCQS